MCLDCAGVIGLHVHPSRKESKKVAKNSGRFVCFRDLTPGVPKWCPRGAPGVAKGFQQAPPAALNVAKRGAKDVEMDAFGYVMWSQGPSQAPSKLQVPNLIQKGIKMDGQNMLSLAFTRDL